MVVPVHTTKMYHGLSSDIPSYHSDCTFYRYYHLMTSLYHDTAKVLVTRKTIYKIILYFKNLHCQTTGISISQLSGHSGSFISAVACLISTAHVSCSWTFNSGLTLFSKQTGPKSPEDWGMKRDVKFRCVATAKRRVRFLRALAIFNLLI